MTLDLDAARPAAEPRLAATLILLRDTARGPEVAVMQRSLESGFLGGAVVFPGGRIEDDDAADAWKDAISPAPVGEGGAWWDAAGIAARIGACREALEEVGVVPVTGPAADRDTVTTLRVAATKGATALRNALRNGGRSLDVAALVPFSRWLTPEAERRRYDTRFFVARAPHGQEGEIDAREAIRVFWARPVDLLAEFERGAMPLFPPTHRTLEQLVPHADVDACLAYARRACLDVICPRFVLDEGIPTLALPGDPLHDVREPRIEGGSRFVLRGDRWCSESR